MDNNIQYMSSRQQLLYLINKTQDDNFKLGNSEEEPTSQFRWIDYFKKRKLEIRSNINKSEEINRIKLHKLSQKEYTVIKKNIYIDRKKNNFDIDDAYICSCDKPKKSRYRNNWEDNINENNLDYFFGCGSSCLNKLISWECVNSLCPWGDLCRNRRFQNNEYVEIYPLKTQNKGWGLFAGQYIPKGTFITQYVGEIYSINSKYGKKKLHEYKDKLCTYLMSISKNEVIDPTLKGNIARFINHSCDPNCETQKWHVLGEICVGVFACKNIHEDEELTFNYGFDLFKTVFQRCYCDSYNCKGYLGLVQPETLNSPNLNIECNICFNVCKNSEMLTVCNKCKRILHKECFNRYNNCNCEGNKSKNLNKNSERCLNENASFNKNNSISKELLSNNKNHSKCVSVDESSLNLNKLDKIDNIEKKNNFELNNNDSNNTQDQKSNNSFSTLSEIKIKNNSNYKINTDNKLTKKINDKNKDKDITKIKKDKQCNNSLKILNENVLKDNSNRPTIKINENLNKNNKLENNKYVNNQQEESMLISKAQLAYIKENLKSLISIGARLFWDPYTKDNSIEIKIIGSEDQIKKIKYLLEDVKIKEDENKKIIYRISIPKIFLRRIVGHQDKNINGYKVKYNIEFDYEASFVSDEIYSITENTFLSLKGIKYKVIKVINEIKNYINKMRILSINLLLNEYLIVKNNICYIKNLLDPVDVRLAKWDNSLSFIPDKIKNGFNKTLSYSYYNDTNDINNVFYFKTNNYKDIVLIGFSHETKPSEQKIKDYLLKKNLLKHTYSICIPIKNKDYLECSKNKHNNYYYTEDQNKLNYYNNNNIETNIENKYISNNETFNTLSYKELIAFKNIIDNELKEKNRNNYIPSMTIEKCLLNNQKYGLDNLSSKAVNNSILFFVLLEDKWIVIKDIVKRLNKELNVKISYDNENFNYLNLKTYIKSMLNYTNNLYYTKVFLDIKNSIYLFDYQIFDILHKLKKAILSNYFNKSCLDSELTKEDYYKQILINLSFIIKSDVLNMKHIHNNINSYSQKENLNDFFYKSLLHYINLSNKNKLTNNNSNNKIIKENSNNYEENLNSAQDFSSLNINLNNITSLNNKNTSSIKDYNLQLKENNNLLVYNNISNNNTKTNCTIIKSSKNNTKETKDINNFDKDTTILPNNNNLSEEKNNNILTNCIESNTNKFNKDINCFSSKEKKPYLGLNYNNYYYETNMNIKNKDIKEIDFTIDNNNSKENIEKKMKDNDHNILLNKKRS